MVRKVGKDFGTWRGSGDGDGGDDDGGDGDGEVVL